MAIVLAQDQDTDRGLTETQIGAVAEAAVASQLILASNGRFSPFKPVADDQGIDLLVYDKITGHAVPVQVKCRTKVVRRHPKTIHFQIRRATLAEVPGSYLLAVLMDLDPVLIRRAWLIPRDRVRSVSRPQGEQFVIHPSMDLNSRDRYTPYRCESMRQVVETLLRQEFRG